MQFLYIIMVSKTDIQDKILSFSLHEWNTGVTKILEFIFSIIFA